jgi:type I restriction enzyme S subunit
VKVSGYKETEIGRIPKEWTAAQLGDVCQVFGRIGFRGYTVNDIVECTEGALAISPSNIKGNVTDFTRCTYISWTKYEESPEIKIREGDILLVKTGSTFGKTAIVRGLREAATLNPQVVVLKKLRIDNLFLGYVMAFTTIQNQISAFVVGGALPTLSQALVMQFRFPLPPTALEQKAIGQALSDADAFIESLEQLIAKKRQIKEGAMQELLCPKKDWVTKRLGSTAILKARIGWQGLTAAEHLDSGDYHLVTGTEFKNGYVDWQNCHCVAEHRYQQDKNIQLRKNDILVTKDGTIGKVALITDLPKPATLNNGVFVIRPTDRAFLPDFLYYLLNSNVFARFLSRLSAGSTINHLYQKDFVNFVYEAPPKLEEQNAIAEVLSDMDAEIAALEAKLGKARQIKQGMMQELLMGRVRLVSPVGE